MDGDCLSDRRAHDGSSSERMGRYCQRHDARRHGVYRSDPRYFGKQHAQRSERWHCGGEHGERSERWCSGGRHGERSESWCSGGRHAERSERWCSGEQHANARANIASQCSSALHHW
jgi:hypothetical protein